MNVINMEASLWNQGLSHINEKRINILAQKDVLLGLKNVDLEKCSRFMADK